MSFIPIRLTRTNGTPVVINAATVSGVFNHQLGKVYCTCLRTIDGNEWLVREPIDYVETAMGGKSSPHVPAPMVVETKVKEKAKK